jgi:hypothetical protein
MTRMRLVVAGAVGALVLAAAVAATASASNPALYECAKATKNAQKKYTGKYLDKKCSKEATKSEIEAGKTNKYELQEWAKEVAKVKVFKGKGSAGDLEVEGVGEVQCSKSADTGEFNGPKSADNVKVTFTSCATLGHKCESPGAAVGEIRTETLEGEVGYLAGGGTESPIVGVDLKPQPPAKYLAQFTCNPEELNLRVRGSVVGEVLPPYNKFTKEATLKFHSHNGIQEWESFEGGPIDTLISESCFGCEPSGEDPSGESQIVTNKGEELELKA